MKKKIYNPYLPLDEYVPDGEPHVFGDRLYVYGSHDEQNGKAFCTLDYVCYSAPLNDLSDWRYEGVIYKKEEDTENKDGKLQLYAPDVCQGPDGSYYLYYCLQSKNLISVAKCSTPAGRYQFIGHVRRKDGRPLTENQPFDPAVLNDNGSIYLYYGFSPTNINIPGISKKDLSGCSFIELKEDMVTLKTEPKTVIPSENSSSGTGFEGHEYFEAPSIRKIGNTYYLVYSSVLSHELCYCTSPHAGHGFKYGGTIVSNGDIGLYGRSDKDKVALTGNNHGGMVQINGQWYIFYHRHTHGRQFSRQGCAEPIYIEPDGSIPQVEITSSGLNGSPLSAQGSFPAAICSTLTNHNMPNLLGVPPDYSYPYIFSENKDIFVTNFTNGNLIGFKYFKIESEAKVSITYRTVGKGLLYIGLNEDEKHTSIKIAPSKLWVTSDAVSLPGSRKASLYFSYEGSGALDLLSFSFE